MIYRHIDKLIDKYSTIFPSILITGARQTGKATALTESLKNKNVEYVTFDDLNNVSFAQNDPKFFFRIK